MAEKDSFAKRCMVICISLHSRSRWPRKIPSPRDAYEHARKMYKKSRQGERTPRGFGQKSEQAMLEKKHADMMAKKEELRAEVAKEE